MKSFAANAKNLPVLPDHDADFTSALFINFEWRRFVSDALQAYADNIIRGLADADVDDFRNKFQAFLIDLYSLENMDNVPVGTIANFVSTTMPEKWLYLNGQDVYRDDYPELWDVVPAIWHDDEPITGNDIISLPDMRERFAYGATNSSVIGASGGEATHTLTIAEMPAHTHTMATATAVGTTATRVADGGGVAGNNVPTLSTGGGGAHNNLPPYIMLTWMIKALP